MANCPTCGDSFTSMGGMRSHHTQIHGESLTMVEVSCNYCENVCKKHESKLERSEKLFCSQECQSKHISENKERHPPTYSGEEHPQYNRKITNCNFCGEEILIQPHKLEDREKQFCNHNCRSSWQSKNVVGENHHQLKRGSQTYKGGWKRKRINAIISSLGRCEKCGMAENDHISKYGFSLHVHHKKPIRTFDSHNKANKQNNLQTLCVDCHVKEENKK